VTTTAAILAEVPELAAHPLPAAVDDTSAMTRATTRSLAADVRTMAGWTLFGRLTGFARVAVMAAVLGPTYFGNLYLIIHSIPLMALELFFGSMITVLLVPTLVRRIDAGDRLGAERLANGLLGLLTLFACLLLGLILLFGGLLLDLVTIAVDDPLVREQQRLLGWPLLLIMMPQLVLHIVVAVAIAVQHAHGRFALATGAHAIENIGMVGILLLAAWIYGIGVELQDVTMGHLLLLALGSTATVAIHAAVQWWGAFRTGIRLVPWPAWRDPGIREILRMAAPTGGNSALRAGSWLGVTVAAGALPGGVVALDIARTLFNLPIALGARPAAAAQLPRLSRHVADHDHAAFRSTYRDSMALARFVALPASLVFLLMPETLARAVSFGTMASEEGLALVAAAILGLGVGLMGEAVIVLGTAAAYARRNAMAPFQAMLIRVAVLAIGVALALGTMHGPLQLMALCLALSAGNLAGAVFLKQRLGEPWRLLPQWSAGSFWADLAASLVAVVPAMLLARYLAAGIEVGPGQVVLAVATLGLAGALYLLVQWLCSAPALVAVLQNRDPSPAGERSPGGHAEPAARPPC
jgi:putative peptidoglycan lipid II flippase